MSKSGGNRRGPKLIMGDRVYLRWMEKDDLPGVKRWSEDPDLRAAIGQVAPLSDLECEEWFRDVENDENRAWYVIVTVDGDRVIGEAGLLRIFEPWRTTDMTVIIAEENARGKGYGREVGRMLLDFAFNYMGLHRVAVGVVGFHEEGLKYWEGLGFRREGTLRDGYFLNGVFHDFVMLSILAPEWQAGLKDQPVD